MSMEKQGPKKLKAVKSSLRDRLKQSELRNRALAEYTEFMENTCKEVFRVCAEQHEDMRLLILPSQKGAKAAFKDICCALVPVAIDDLLELRKYIHEELAVEIENKLKIGKPEEVRDGGEESKGEGEEQDS